MSLSSSLLGKSVVVISAIPEDAEIAKEFLLSAGMQVKSRFTKNVSYLLCVPSVPQLQAELTNYQFARKIKIFQTHNIPIASLSDVIALLGFNWEDLHSTYHQQQQQQQQLQQQQYLQYEQQMQPMQRPSLGRQDTVIIEDENENDDDDIVILSSISSPSSSLATPQRRRSGSDSKNHMTGTISKKRQTPPRRTPTKNQEKRLKRMRTESSPVKQRITRALSQRMYLLDQKEILGNESESGPSRRYTVAGSTGNVYEVEIGQLVTCSCPDHIKGNVCKHQLFVFLRVLRVSRESHISYQTALLSSERREVFENADAQLPNAVIPNQSARNLYRRLTGEQEDGEKEKENDQNKHRGNDDDDCPVCYEEFGTKEPITVCPTCQNGIHSRCFDLWVKQKRCRPGDMVACVHCRSDMPCTSPNASQFKASQSNENNASFSREGYLNVGEALQLPTRRDTSTYHSYKGRCKYDYYR